MEPALYRLRTSGPTMQGMTAPPPVDFGTPTYNNSIDAFYGPPRTITARLTWRR